MTRILATVVTAAALLAACSNGHRAAATNPPPTGIVPSQANYHYCPPPRTSGTPILTMTNTAPRPTQVVAVGKTFYVVSKYGSGTMRVPVAARQDSSVRLLGSRHCAGGAAVAAYRALSPGRVLSSSSYTVATPLMDPAMFAIAVIRR